MQKRTLNYFSLIYLILVLNTVSLFGQVNLQIQASHTSGVAPLYVFFDATNSTGLTDTNDLVNADFQWNFDATNTDPNGNWEETKGMVAGHVFEEAGTYSVQCTVTAADGTTDTETTTITVSAFSGTTYYVSNSGDDGNDGLSVSTPWQTANFAFGQLGANERILFNRGDIFNNVNYPFQILSGGKRIIGAYGNGAQPVLSGTTDVASMLELDFVEDMVFMDLHIDVNAPGTGGSNFSIENCTDIVLLNLDLEGSTSLSVYNDDCNQIGVFDCSVHDFGVLATYAGNSTRLSWVGNTINNLIGTPQPEHGIRIQGGEKQFIAHNILTNLTETKSAIQIRGDGQRHVMIYKNKMDRLLGVNPQNAGTISAISDVTIEGNYIGQNEDYTGTSWQNSNNGINIEATNIAIRNNVIDGYRNAINVGHDYNGVVSGMVDIFHNTVNWRPVSPQSNIGGRIVRIADVDHINVHNNLITVANISEALVIDSAGTNIDVSYGNNLISTPWDYVVNPLPNSAADENDLLNYQILMNSQANNAGGNGIPVFFDAINLNRNSVSPDVGAFEYSESMNIPVRENTHVSIYPNPTNGIFRIQLDGKNTTLQFALYNSMGVQVVNEVISENHAFDTSDLPKGIYYWQLKHEETEIKSGKLVML